MVDEHHAATMLATQGSPAAAAQTRETVNALWAAATDAGERLASASPCSEACVFAADAGSGTLVPVFTTARIAEAIESGGTPLGQDLSSWVSAHRHTIVNSDPRLDLGSVAVTLGLRNAICTPIFALGTVVGVLSVYTERPGGFSDAESRSVAVVAQEIASQFVDQSRQDGRNTRTGDRALALAS